VARLTGARPPLARAAGAVLVLALVWPCLALAHASVVRTEPPTLCSSPDGAPRATGRVETPAAPAPPDCPGGVVLAEPPASVRIWFSEPVTPVAGGISVRGPSGRRVERGPARSEGIALAVDVDAIETGTYLVTWRVVAEDTHPARGAFTFSVGHPSPVGGAAPAESPLPLAAQALAQALHFVGYALGFGSLAFRLLASRPLGARHPEWLVGLGALLLLLAEPLALLAQAASLGGDAAGTLDLDVLGDALGSSFGRVLAQRLGAAVLLWVLVGVAPQAPRLASGGVVALGLALAVADGQAAHATGVRPAWLGLALNALHLAAMGLWLGGLATLLASRRHADSSRGTPRDGSRGDPASLALRARPLFTLSLATLGISGAAMAAEHLTALSDLLASAYGRVLVAKLALLLPALLAAVVGLRAVGTRRWRWWGWEAVLLLGVLLLAGLLVSLPPPA